MNPHNRLIKKVINTLIAEGKEKVKRKRIGKSNEEGRKEARSKGRKKGTRI